MKQALFAAALLATLGLAHAKDHGVQGNVWPIIEVDMRQTLLESAARTDWGKVNQQVIESGKRFLSNLPKRQLPQASQTGTAYFDPSLVLTSDIQAPVKQGDGTYKWEVLAAKGSKVNPLDSYHPVTALFFFDGSQQDQRDLLKKLFASGEERIVPIEAGSGDVKDLGDTFERPIYHASDAIVSRFQVKYLPSLVYPGTGTNSKYIAVTSFGQPYKPEEVLHAWDEIKPSQAAQASLPAPAAPKAAPLSTSTGRAQ
jgi:conjugal transfer pilus assembly protein TraW